MRALISANALELYWLPEDPDWESRLAALRIDHKSSAGALKSAARQRIDFVQTLRLDRVMRSCVEPPAGCVTVRLAVLGSSTLQHLLPGIRVAGLRRNLWVSTYSTDYAQYLQELVDPASGLHQFQPNAVLFAFDAAHLLGDGCAVDAGAAAVESAVERCIAIWRRVCERFDAHVIQQMVLPTAPNLLGQNEHRCQQSVAGLIELLNWRLREAADREGVDVLALDKRVACDGLQAWYDVVLWHQAKQEVSPSASHVYGELVARLLAARRGLSAKCLVLDLDNTLWGGVVGDDGVEGIVLGNGSGAGESHLAFQSYVQALARRGVILAVCSKNDEAHARLPFEKHPEMLLQLSDIACFVANWEDKATNLRRIAEQLRIGVDSLVLVDDSPFERELVRHALPEVAVPELPPDPSMFARCLADTGYFELINLTREDMERSASYRANLHRDSARGDAVDLDSYLRDLRMELLAKPFDRIGLPRIVQLIHKTNQFNLTTRRYSEYEILSAISDPTSLTLQFRLIDRFGDNGIIALILGKLEPATVLTVDLWLMSCRVLGRQVEEATMNMLVSEARRRGVHRIVGVYCPTAKNGMVRDHYREMGFTLDRSEQDGSTYWGLELDQYRLLPEFMTETTVEMLQ